MSAELENYISSGKPKDGLSRCTKLLKKAPKDASLALYKIRFLRQLHQDAEAKAALDELCNRKPAILEPHRLAEIDELIYQTQVNVHPRPLTSGPEAERLWSNAANAVPKQQAKDLYIERLNSAIDQRRWLDAASAVLGLKKTNPEDQKLRNYHVTIQQIIGSTDVNEQRATLNRELAFRTLDKSVIDSDDQLLFYMTICERQGRDRELVDKYNERALRGPSTGNWQLVGKTIDAAIRLKDWPHVAAFSGRLLSLEQPDKDASSQLQGESQALRDLARKDWKLWSAYLQASAEIRAWPLMDQVFSTIPEGHTRLRGLAVLYLAHLVLLQSEPHTKLTRDGRLLALRPSETPFEVVQSWFSEDPARVHCVTDCVEFLRALPPKEALELRNFVAARSMVMLHGTSLSLALKKQNWLYAELNALHVEYILAASISSVSDPAYFDALACTILRIEALGRAAGLGNLLAANRFCADVLVRRSQQDSAGPHLLQAAALCFHAANEGNSAATLNIIFMLVEMGLYSEAMNFFKQLGVKEIQYETVSHMLLTRISTTHPFTYTERSRLMLDPLEILRQALTMYEVHDGRLAGYQVHLLNTTNHSLMLEIEDLRQTLASSITRRVALLEQRRAARLTDQSLLKRFDLTPATIEHWTQALTDKREFDQSYLLEPKGQEATRQMHQGGRLPGGQWVQATLAMDHIATMINGGAQLCPEADWEKMLHGLFVGTDSQELTDMEIKMLPCWEALGRVANSTLQSPPDKSVSTNKTAARDFEHYLSTFQTSLENTPIHHALDHETIPGRPPISRTLETYFLIFDYLKSAWSFTLAAIDISKSRRPGRKISMPVLDKIRDVIKSHFEALQTHARRQKSKVSARALETFMLSSSSSNSTINGGSTSGEKSVVAEQLAADDTRKDLFGHFAGVVAASAEDAWDGVLKVRLGPGAK